MGLPTHIGCRHPETDPENDQFCIFCLRKRGDDALLELAELRAAALLALDLAQNERPFVLAAGDALKRITAILEPATKRAAKTRKDEKGPTMPIDFDRLIAELKAKRLREYEEASPEEKARLDEARRLQEEDDARPRFTAKALRTCAWNGTTKEVDVVFVVRPGHDDRRWLFIDGGGVTGYESVPFDVIAEDDGRSWTACSGTKDRWDRLVVPAESLRKVCEALR